MHPRLKQLVPSGLVLVALALIAIVTLLFVGAQSGEEEEGTLRELLRHATKREDVTLGLLVAHVSDRGKFSVCVDGAGGLRMSEADVTKVAQAVEDVFIILPDIPREVAVGCSPALALTGDYRDRFHRGALDVPSRFIGAGQSASPHRVFLYFAPADVYGASFGSDPYAITAAEYRCATDVCHWVSQAIYVKPGANRELLLQALMDVLGLLPRAEWNWEACPSDRPVPWCDTYRTCFSTQQPWCEAFWRLTGRSPAPP